MMKCFVIVSLAVAHAIRKNVSGRFLIGIDANVVRITNLIARCVSTHASFR